MTARSLSGKPVADAINLEVAEEIRELRSKYDISPCLAVVRVGEDPASSVYVNNKIRTAEALELISEHHHLPETVKESEVVRLVDDLNSREDVDGILVQLPLPRHIDERAILERIEPSKDVDGFHPVNAGRLAQGHSGLEPCTPAGVIELLKRSDIPIAGRHAVVVGRSNIVGKPMAMLLLRENATVTICHSRSSDLPSITRMADILVAGIGRAGFLGSEHIRDGAVVIDVGINRVSDEAQIRGFFSGDELEKRMSAYEKRGSTLVGDVNPSAAMEKAAAYTPVPGGVGLLTVAMLMKNTVKAARQRRNI